MKLLFLGDIFGRPGRKVVKNLVPELRKEYKIDLVIANCENLASGRGITSRTAEEMFRSGVDLFTGGNHLWDKRESYDYIRNCKKIVRPANYPPSALGQEKLIHTCENGIKIGVFNLVGQAFMSNSDNPFLKADALIEELSAEVKIIFVDFHAESTAEKRSMGFYLDGRVSALIGTHTHIQTADEEILPQGAAYITDAGMTGAHDSVIGVKKEIILDKIKTGMPNRYEASDKGLQINGVIIEIDNDTGKSLRIERLRRKYNDT
ncbi:MAG: TIGR00282 family metallophosphoesterase [Candidatus Cloacimonadota bacterium]|nr:MAG: TIGR00282 family metallophosphoesterase [Candidatus Cloacimonadota bacterium]